MLLNKVPLLEAKIDNLETINSNLLVVDSLRCQQIDLYDEELLKRENRIQELNKTVKSRNLLASGSVITTIILAILCVLK